MFSYILKSVPASNCTVLAATGGVAFASIKLAVHTEIWMGDPCRGSDWQLAKVAELRQGTRDHTSLQRLNKRSSCSLTKRR